MILFVSSLLTILQLAPPLEEALQATEAPKSVRVAFEVELSTEDAIQVYRFDPRLPQSERWQLMRAAGEDAYLDQIAANWGAEAAPDGRLFPDDLRNSIGASP